MYIIFIYGKTAKPFLTVKAIANMIIFTCIQKNIYVGVAKKLIIQSDHHGKKVEKR